MPHEAQRRPPSPGTIALALAALALVLLAWHWFAARSETQAMRQELAQRLAEIDAQNREGRVLAQQAQETSRDIAVKVGVLEDKLAQSQNQQVALETLYQELSRNRDDWSVSEIEQIMAIASQQLQLAGDVRAALLALQTADSRLQRLDKPQLIPLRKVIGKDIERLKALPYVDTVGIAVRLDSLLGQVDALPLAMEVRPLSERETAPPAPADESAWQRVIREALADFKQMVRLQKLDRNEVPLLAPEQAYFARENLKLRLLSARIALLQRDPVAYSADITAARDWLNRYFDTQNKAVTSALASLRELGESPVSIELPDLAASLEAVRSYKIARDTVEAPDAATAAKPAHEGGAGAMKALLWLLALAALAVGLTVASRYSSGYVLIVLPPYRAELSVNLLVLIALAGYALFYLMTRFVSNALHIPEQVREFQETRRRERARRALNEAIGALFVGRFARAERSAAEALELDESPILAAVIAARAAHELKAFDKRDEYLARATRRDSPDADLARVAQAELLAEQQRFDEALTSLQGVEHKHPAVMRLELRLQQRLGNWDRVLELASSLGKRGVFDALRVEQVSRNAHIENLRRRTLDAASLNEYWQKLAAEERTDTKIAAVAAQVYIALGGCRQAHGIIEDSLAVAWDSGLVALYGECLGADVLRQIELAEKWLPDHPDDATLLLTLGRLCARQGLWGKAESYLEASLSVEESYSAHLGLAQLKERRDLPEVAATHYRKGLELALHQVRSNTGGRRRTVV